MALDRVNNDSIAKLVAQIKSGDIIPAKPSPDHKAIIRATFAAMQENSISNMKKQFKTDIQDIHQRGLDGRKVATTDCYIEKSPTGDKVTQYLDAEGNIIYEKREAHDGHREKITYYGANGKPTIGYNIYNEHGISGFQALQYCNGKEGILWQTK